MLSLVTVPRNPWSIFDDLESLQDEMNRMFADRGYGRALRRSRASYPALNVWSSAEGMIIAAELPGIDPADVDVSVHGDELTLRGKVKAPALREGESYQRRERAEGEFLRVLRLPFRADAGGVKAGYRNGILRLTVPRHEAEKPRKIAVQAA
jgi:HSP20 family protein